MITCYKTKVCVDSVKTLFIITRLASRNLVIIGPNSLEMLTKSVIRSSWNWLEHCSESLVHLIGIHIWSLLTPNSLEKLTKCESMSRCRHCSKSLVRFIGSYI